MLSAAVFVVFLFEGRVYRNVPRYMLVYRGGERSGTSDGVINPGRAHYGVYVDATGAAVGNPGWRHAHLRAAHGGAALPADISQFLSCIPRWVGAWRKMYAGAHRWNISLEREAHAEYARCPWQAAS